MRLLGVGVSNLVAGPGDRQLSLLDELDAAAEGEAPPSATDGRAAATDAVDRAASASGPPPSARPSLAGPAGIRVRRRGDQQWGPDQDDHGRLADG